ncbi:toll/interleukin-1 receptor domain-containing protein [candidate division KSB1 bacterium]|nr:toll/interleukin-1 receptor domain-containing protein [candidate division KSB1 bacterium]
MSKPAVFMSYARQDLGLAKKFERALAERGFSVWRDQESIYAGENWPKAIGEAISSQNYVLLFWSRNAGKSHFVEFEWTTAIALRKSILPCLLE